MLEWVLFLNVHLALAYSLMARLLRSSSALPAPNQHRVLPPIYPFTEGAPQDNTPCHGRLAPLFGHLEHETAGGQHGWERIGGSHEHVQLVERDCSFALAHTPVTYRGCGIMPSERIQSKQILHDTVPGCPGCIRGSAGIRGKPWTQGREAAHPAGRVAAYREGARMAALPHSGRAE